MPRTGAFHSRRVPSTRASLRREPSSNFGDVVEARERQLHMAFRTDMTGSVHRRIPSRADAPARDQNHPMMVFVAISVPRRDVDGIHAVMTVHAGGRDHVLCVRHAYRGRSHESDGEET